MIRHEVCFIKVFDTAFQQNTHPLIQDRTSELRKKGYQGRRLGPVQMTTDTAVRVTRMVTHSRSKFTPDMSSQVLLV